MKSLTVRFLGASTCAVLVGVVLSATSLGTNTTSAQAGATPTVTPTTTTIDDPDSDEHEGVDYEEDTPEQRAGGGSRTNQVRVMNRTDGRLRVRGKVQLNRITGPVVEPVNFAFAYTSCTDCQGIAVALQVNLVSRDVRQITPQNAAVALNEQCTRCQTVAHAIQYVYGVDDPAEVPGEAIDLIRELNRELREIHSNRHMTLAEAEARVNAVVARFRQFPLILNEARDEKETPDGAPAPLTEPAATAVPTATPNATPVASPTANP